MSSLFIDALAKQIFHYMKYRDEEITKLNEKINSHICLCHSHHLSCDFVQCSNCNSYSHDNCTENWIFTGLTDQGDIVLNPNYEMWDERFDHYMFCSNTCFQQYYGQLPETGKVFRLR